MYAPWTTHTELGHDPGDVAATRGGVAANPGRDLRNPGNVAAALFHVLAARGSVSAALFHVSAAPGGVSAALSGVPAARGGVCPLGSSVGIEPSPTLLLDLPPGILREGLDRIRAAKTHQEMLSASRQQATRDVEQRVREGWELVARLRSQIKADLGRRDERLKLFGIKPIPPRRTTTL